MKITSVNNEIVKETAKLLQKKYRDKYFLLEGEKCINEAINYGLKIERIFVLPELVGKYKNVKADLIEVNEAVLSKISDTKTNPKVVAVAEQLHEDFSKIKDAKKVILLEGIKDAGNLGTIIRTAVGFGADAVVLYGDTIDLYNPKCVRSAVGNLWKIPVFSIDSIDILKEYFGDFDRIATLPNGKNTVMLKDYNKQDKTLVMFGSEADGLSDKLIKYATTNLKIEMSEKVESLNLSVSAAVVMHKLFIR